MTYCNTIAIVEMSSIVTLSFSAISTCDNFVLVSKTFLKGKLSTLTSVLSLIYLSMRGESLVGERPGEGKGFRVGNFMPVK